MKLLKNMKIILSGHEAKEKSPEDMHFYTFCIVLDQV